jgi:hypothetical protein
MAYTDLREFIAALEKHGELKRVAVEVDPVLEITEFADRAVKSGGPALLFERPEGLRRAGADQRLRQHAAHGDRAGSAVGGRRWRGASRSTWKCACRRG